MATKKITLVSICDETVPSAGRRMVRARVLLEYEDGNVKEADIMWPAYGTDHYVSSGENAPGTPSRLSNTEIMDVWRTLGSFYSYGGEN